MIIKVKTISTLINKMSNSTSSLIPYPVTTELKPLRGTVLQTLIKISPYRKRKHPAVINFSGTVKVHGTNISIIFFPTSAPQMQSRNNVITTANDDGYGSASWLFPHLQLIQDTLKEIPIGLIKQEIMVAGEMAGKGIFDGQSAVSELERFYMIFGIRVDGVWLDKQTLQNVRFPFSTRIFNANEFRTFEATIDFQESREEGGGKLVQNLCQDVQNECPVALQLGGLRNGLGEGIVWVEERDENALPTKVQRFKSKAPAFKMTCLPSQQDTSSASEFVASCIGKQRFEQGLEVLIEELGRGKHGGATAKDVLIDNSNIQRIANWAMKDAIKEQFAEMQALGLNKGQAKGEVQKIVVQKAKDFFVERQKA